MTTGQCSVVAAWLTVTDFNRDRKSDILLINCEENTIVLLLGRGDGTFEPRQTFYADDSNKDNIVDIVTFNLVDNTISLLFGDENATSLRRKSYEATNEPFFSLSS